MGTVRVYTMFQNHLQAIADFSGAAAQATRLTGQRTWQYPPLTTVAEDTGDPSTTWNGDPNDIVGMSNAFNRYKPNGDYQKIIGDPSVKGKQGEAMLAKLQCDYVASMERAFRTRHASSVRCKIHAGGRRAGHAMPTGPFTGTLLDWLTRMQATTFGTDPQGQGDF